VALLKRLATLALAALPACSLVLDPDELTAELARDASDTDTADAPPIETNDTSDPDTSDPDTSDPDTSDPDTSDPDTTPADVAPDAAEPVVVVRYSGGSPPSCTLDYKLQLVTNCAQPCPNGATWTLVVDASESTGVDTFAWRFGATDGYGVSPTTASSARVDLTLTPPDCEIVAGSGMGPGSIAIELSVNGGDYEPLSPLRWSVRSVAAAACTSQGNCPAP